MVEKHGSEAAVRTFMRSSANKSSRNSGGKGGFAKMQQENPERLQQIAREASKKRWQSNSNSNTKT